MPDIWSARKRSEVMGLVRSSGNRSTEVRVMRIWRDAGVTGWRRNQKLVGRPDFVWRLFRLCVFVDGCFWHGCARCYRRPSSNRKYWDAKVARNRLRDRAVNRALRKQDWQVVRIWEHELSNPGRVVSRVRAALRRGGPRTTRAVPSDVPGGRAPLSTSQKREPYG
jgi:DNA mismatch endonuclease (patch repair protein)